MKENEAPKACLRSEYCPPDWTIEHIALQFDLIADATTVTAEMQVKRCDAEQLDASSSTPPLVLDGVDLQLLSVAVDGKPLSADDYHCDDVSLTLHELPSQCLLSVVTRIDPVNNKALEGLYQSSGNFCTQCEAQGFRKIMYYLDRPDVLAVFDVKIIASQQDYPVLLANGNKVAEGSLDDGRHFAQWHDPFPKPCYLFALVAGALDCVTDTFTTASGREVDLRIYVESHNIDKCDHAMLSLKNSMRWDEEVYGLEYDLDIYMVVAVDDFNMGAMENKGLNIFNSKYVLADRQSATDSDFLGVEGVIAHEYFHNWTGNRVTCRDWFQLSLKEGLTVFRDQEFSSDMNSRSVKRIGDVRLLKARQFPEDAGPMAHPIRPDSYIEINNFYTITVYEKGAEVIRMMHTLLGADKFRKGIDLYFERHDGQAVTCEDFVLSMEAASGVSLEQFRRWYSQAGTPEVTASSSYSAETGEFQLHLKQSCPATPGQDKKLPFHIPVSVALLDAEGGLMPLESTSIREVSKETVLDLKETQQTIVFTGLQSEPIPSLLRNFTAPVHLNYDYSDDQLAFLMANDSDLFNRWDAGQRLVRRVIENRLKDEGGNDGQGSASDSQPSSVEDAWIVAFGKLLADEQIDPALKAEMLIIPGIESVAELHDEIDIEGIDRARTAALVNLAETHAELLTAVYQQVGAEGSAGAFSVDSVAVGRRSLANACLGILSRLPQDAWLPMALARFQGADNMTDRVASLQLLCSCINPLRDDCLAEFYDQWKHDKLVLDKWFTVQAIANAPDTVDRVLKLRSHADFSLSNPNRVRSLIGAFAMSNTKGFHCQQGYTLLGDVVLDLDADNPQVAARLVGALTRWRRFDVDRQAMMQQQLQRIRGVEGLSKDVFEIVSKSLV